MTHQSRLAVLIFLLLFLPFSASAKAALQRVHFTTEELKTIQGHYSTIFGYIYIKVNGKQVTAHVDRKTIQLIKKSDGRFYPSYKILKLIPINLGDMSFSLTNANRKIQIWMRSRNTKTKKNTTKVVAQKFAPVTVPPFWKKKLGKYKATLVKGRSKIKNIRLTIERGILVAYINKYTSPYPLLAISASTLYSPSSGRRGGRQIKIASTAKNMTLKYGKTSLLLKKL